ncbi:PP2C family protein-serine/threonine phosphatase [Kallotenue papyrolyticum]|uniref:PP2C family protein-serine/threonine phosphatase n=1 Tax=Kallotenue papyrolyticum TaxID=1325125 RepID=UPI00047270D0|nr:protein phosphatase 2C domain-containing protein [Kallotenue papyrolyticum]
MQLRHAALTDVGATRDHNEDSYGIEVGGERPHAGALFVVCDGIGGFARGEVASELAVRTIIEHFFADAQADREAALVAAVQAANQAVFRAGGGNMGTTGVAAVFKDDALIVANVGDCRAYLVRGGQAYQITRDHSFVAEQVAAGAMTEQQAQRSSYRNIITRAIGHRPDVAVDTFRLPLLQDDVVVLCSDGLHGQVTAEEIALAFTKTSLEHACRALVRLANERGGPDNITVVAVQVAALTFAGESVDGAETPAVGAPQLPPAITARLAEAPPPVPAAGRTAKLATERRSGVDRRQQALPVAPEAERRRGERRQTPSQRRPAPSAHGSLRALLLWTAGLALLGALLLGAYYVSVFTNQAATPTITPPARPTLTPLGAPTPTLVPTVATPQP